MAKKNQSDNDRSKCGEKSISAAPLLAAVSYMTDIIPGGCLFHSWRIALAAEHIAASVFPDEAAEVFYAGLMQEVGCVGAARHVTAYCSLADQLDDHIIKTHPRRGGALLEWLPGMSESAKMVRYHHEWWNGSGYQDGLSGTDIPQTSQLLLLVETLDTIGCFRSWQGMAAGLRQLACCTKQAWNKQIWTSVVQSLEDAEFYTRLMSQEALHGLISDCLTRHPVPSELDNEAGVERIFHIFAALVDAKDPTTVGHSRRTAIFARLLAEHMGLSEQEIQLAYRAGLVHDCGRLGLPASLLRRSGRLSPEEMEQVRQHAQMTNRVMNCMPDCAGMLEIGRVAGYDHERYDGTGYPDRLTGENIPLISRILSVVDAFDAMTSAATYKNLLSPRFAVIRLQQAAGTQFDPNVVDAMASAVESKLFQVAPSEAA